MMNRQFIYILGAFFVFFMQLSDVNAQDNKSWMPEIGGTLRVKYEYQTDEGNSRFQVRDARLNAKGWLTSFIDYKMEINLSDKGKIKTHDMFARFPFGKDKEWKLTLGQFSVPISIDAARSPHLRWFANRSFVGKQVGNVFDVGGKLSWVSKKIPLTIEAGMYNGKGAAPTDAEWQKKYLYMGRVGYRFPHFELRGGVMTYHPYDIQTTMYDAGVTFTEGRFSAEIEYLCKDYSDDRIKSQQALNVMARYSLPLKSDYINTIHFLGRFDYMTDGIDGTFDEGGNPLISDVERKRFTAGVTLGYYKKVRAELRLNFEKYFYNDGVAIGVSDHDKAVAELMINF